MRLSTEKKLLTVRVGLFSLREKAPTKNNYLPTKNKAGTCEVRAISKAQKAQSVQNCKRGDSLGFLKIQFVAKYQKK